MPHFHFFIHSNEYGLLYEGETHALEVRTPWIQKHAPDCVTLSFDGEHYTVPLLEGKAKSGRRLLRYFHNLGKFNVRIVFSEGTDAARPSWSGTITLVPVTAREGVPA